MKTLLQSSIEPRRAWWLVAMFLALCCRQASAQSIMISNFTQFQTAIDDPSIGVITNFQTNISIFLSSAGESLAVHHTLLIDGGTNGVVLDAQGSTRIFTVATNCLLT